MPATEAASWRYGGRASGIHYDSRAGVLDGSIPFVAYGGSADAFLVATDSPANAVLAIVSRQDVSVATEANVDGSSSTRLTFAAVHVPAQRLIATGAEARRLAVEMQEFLILGAAVELIGLAAAALDVTLDYIKMRQQFGRPIGSFQVLQHRAVNGFIDIELNRSLVYRVLAAYDRGEHHPAMVSAAKARASRAALDIVRGALQMHGAIGYTEEHDIGLYYKRAMALAARYGGELSHAGRLLATHVRGGGMTEAPSIASALLCVVDRRGVATLTLNRPDKGNSYNHAMLDALQGEIGRTRRRPGGARDRSARRRQAFLCRRRDRGSASPGGGTAACDHSGDMPAARHGPQADNRARARRLHRRRRRAHLLL